MYSLHEYVMDIVASEENMMAEQESDPHARRGENGKLVNWQYGRVATPEEEKAIGHFVDMELEATQMALKKIGEAPLTPAEAQRFWKIKTERKLWEDDIYGAKKYYQYRMDAMKKHPFPNLYKQALLDAKVNDLLENWGGYSSLKEMKAENSLIGALMFGGRHLR